MRMHELHSMLACLDHRLQVHEELTPAACRSLAEILQASPHVRKLLLWRGLRWSNTPSDVEDIMALLAATANLDELRIDAHLDTAALKCLAPFVSGQLSLDCCDTEQPVGEFLPISFPHLKSLQLDGHGTQPVRIRLQAAPKLEKIDAIAL
jgi:hypothetical protein